MQLPLSKQFIVLVQLPTGDAPLEQITQRPHLVVGGLHGAKVADEGDSDRVRVVVGRVQTRHIPTASLEDDPVATDQEVESDVLVVGGRMLCLYFLQDSRAVELEREQDPMFSN